jgi:thiol-disulfide isomerase/thioredoxin
VFVWFDGDKQWVQYGLGVKRPTVMKIEPGEKHSDARMMPRSNLTYCVEDWHTFIKALLAGRDVALRESWAWTSHVQNAFVSLDEDGMRQGLEGIKAAAAALPEIPDISTPEELKELCATSAMVLVLFYRPTWCPKTKDLAPIVRKANALAASQLPGGEKDLRFAVHVLRDTEDNPEVKAHDPLVRSLLEGQLT